MKELYLKIKSNTLVLDVVLLAISLVLVLPFFILTFYNNPSIDDYSFVFLVKTMGFWGAQHNWYTTWTGRYSSMFILSLHPLLLESLILYKIISVFIIFFTIHAFYRLVSFLYSKPTFVIKLIISIIFSFAFFSGMPSVVQGLYWEPGSITYQLANILLLYLIINVIRLIIAPNKQVSFSKLGISYFLIIVIGGLNETSMLLMVVLLLFLTGIDFLLRRKINFTLLTFMATAVISALIVLLAPGNKGREASFVPKTVKIYTLPFLLASFLRGNLSLSGLQHLKLLS